MAEWVEGGRAPHTLEATKLNESGAVQFTRPLCEYPTYPAYLGRGNPSDALSFTCVMPQHANYGLH